MGLPPTHRHESPTLAPTDSKWVIRDFRQSVMAVIVNDPEPLLLLM